MSDTGYLLVHPGSETRNAGYINVSDTNSVILCKISLAGCRKASLLAKHYDMGEVGMMPY